MPAVNLTYIVCALEWYNTTTSWYLAMRRECYKQQPCMSQPQRHQLHYNGEVDKADLVLGLEHLILDHCSGIIVTYHMFT